MTESAKVVVLYARAATSKKKDTRTFGDLGTLKRDAAVRGNERLMLMTMNNKVDAVLTGAVELRTGVKREAKAPTGIRGALDRGHREHVMMHEHYPDLCRA